LAAHRDRIDVLRVELGPELERLSIARFREFIVAAEDAKRLALAKTVEELESGRARDPSRSMQNIAQAQGLAVQRMLELDGRPQGVDPDTRSVGELLKRLEGLGAIAKSEPVVDVVATEIPSESA
jgi:hypothetical protein